MDTNSSNTKTFHLPISYLLILSFLIQIVVISFGASTIGSGETFLTFIFFIEGLWLYFSYAEISDTYISIYKPFHVTKTIYFKDVEKVELEGLDLRIVDSKTSLVLPISQTLINNLENAQKEIPDITQIKEFKMKAAKFTSMIALQIFLITLIWSVDLRAIGAQFIANIFIGMSIIELILLIRTATTSISYNRGSVRVRGAFRIARNVQWVQITSAKTYSSNLLSHTRVYCMDKTLFVANNLINMGLFLYLGNRAGWEITKLNN